MSKYPDHRVGIKTFPQFESDTNLSLQKGKYVKKRHWFPENGWQHLKILLDTDWDVKYSIILSYVHIKGWSFDLEGYPITTYLELLLNDTNMDFKLCVDNMKI